MKLTLILCSVMLALVVVTELVVARSLDEKFEGTVHVVQTQKHTYIGKLLIFNSNAI